MQLSLLDNVSRNWKLPYASRPCGCVVAVCRRTVRDPPCLCGILHPRSTPDICKPAIASRKSRFLQLINHLFTFAPWLTRGYPSGLWSMAPQRGPTRSHNQSSPTWLASDLWSVVSASTPLATTRFTMEGTSSTGFWRPLMRQTIFMCECTPRFLWNLKLKLPPVSQRAPTK